MRRSALGDLLAAHVPVDAREAAWLARMRSLLDVPGDPFDRRHVTPGHFTASAFVLSPERDALLLIFHGKLHRWLQPGGHVEPGDVDVVAAARREVSEEVGLEAVSLAAPGIFDVDVHEIPAIKGDPPHEHHDVRFLFQAPSRSFAAGSDATAARWVPLDAMASIDTDESVLRAVRKLNG